MSARTSRFDPTNIFANIQRSFSSLDDKLDKSAKRHLRNVYGTLATGLGAAALGAAIHLFTDLLRASFLLSFVSIGLMIALFMTPPTVENRNKRLAYFLGFCLISGVSTGPLLERVMAIDPTVILTAFLSTVFVFSAFTLSALYAPSTKYIYLGGTLASASFGLMLMALLTNFYNVILWAGLAISCGFILYDTQLIIEKNRMGDELFIDFVQVFRYLLVLLAQKRESEENERRRRR